MKVLGRPNSVHVEDKWELLDMTDANGSTGAGTAVIGTPDDMVAAIRKLRDVTGGFGTMIGFAHDWADREATFRSWELFARYVIPEINGYTRPMQASADYVTAHKSELMAGAGAAIVEQIKRDPLALEAFAVTLALGANARLGAGSSAAAGAALASAASNVASTAASNAKAVAKPGSGNAAKSAAPKARAASAQSAAPKARAATKPAATKSAKVSR